MSSIPEQPEGHKLTGPDEQQILTVAEHFEAWVMR